MSTPARHQHVTATRALVQSLTRAGWRSATPTDNYTKASGIQWLEPLRPKRSGHTPARIVMAGDAVGLSTYAADGEALEQVSWSWVDPGNLARVHDYVTAALAEALEGRGEI